MPTALKTRGSFAVPINRGAASQRRLNFNKEEQRYVLSLFSHQEAVQLLAHRVTVWNGWTQPYLKICMDTACITIDF